MADDLQQPLSQEDKDWLNTPITVQVPPDDQVWLDTLLEMTPDELRTFAIYNYQIPTEAARSVPRDGLLQLIINANYAGQHGNSGLRPKYRYLPALRNILPPEITQRRGRLLYLTRGEGDTLQVRDKRQEPGSEKEWVPYRSIAPPNEDEFARRAAEDGSGMASEFSPGYKPKQANSPVSTRVEPPRDGNGNDPGQPTGAVPSLPTEVVLAALPKMNRGDLEKVAASLGATDTSDAKFPNIDSLRTFVETALTNKGPGEQTDGQS